MAYKNLGTAWIQIKPSLKGMTSSIRQELSGVGSEEGSSVGQKFSTGFAAKMGVISGITQQVFSKVSQTITSQFSDAIYRADTLNRFPKVMEMMGYSAEDAARSVEKLRDGVKGIPTSLADVVSGTQRLAALTGDVNKASDWALAISDAMLITTGDVNEAARGMEQFIQVLSRGKPQGNDWNTIMEVASPIMNKLAQSLGYAGAELGGDFYTALQNGTLSVEDMMAALVDLDKNGGAGIAALSEQVKTATGGIESTMTNLRQSISNALVDVIQTIGPDTINNIILGIKDVLVGLVSAIGAVVTFIQNNWQIVSPIFTALLGFLGAIVAIFAAQKVYMGLTALFTLITSHPIIMIISAIAGAITLLITHFDEFKQVAIDVWNTVAEWAQNAWNAITGIFSGLANFFGTIFSNAWNAVKNVFSTGGQIFMGIVDGITEAFRNIVNVIITGINHVVAIPFNAINGFLSFLKGIDILGIKPFDWVGTINVPQIPLLATGGRVFGEGTATSDSVPAMLSKGEYVINAATAQQIGYDRLDMLNSTGQMGGEQTINITINGYNKSPEELANIISRKIAFNQRGVIG